MILGTGHQSYPAFTMKSSSLLPLMVLLALGILAPWTVEGGKNDAIKIGACPAEKPAQCLKLEKPQCHSDRECPGKQRCCPYACGVKCMNPAPIRKPDAIKIGACPAEKPAQCLKLEKPQCHSDWECPGKQRCCPYACGARCMNPAPIRKPVLRKPGRCLKTLGRCMMLNPPNHCQRDGQCEGKYKCCEGMCGKVCLPPM